ncbi:hypothetical protein BMS3Bbin06_01424 [bacterium BMS3Bbin06]|nr:hypothetical protein BMS3Bbin06_01424 [bacterium BMS3Bbin06]HDO34906.1 prepilin-type N-terminal cleavage/methylation domain-containing protein [Nitrospirota bacterium]
MKLLNPYFRQSPSSLNNNRTGHHNSERGFTLMELIVVMVLVGIMVGLVGIGFSRALPGAKFRSMVRDISSMLRYAKNNAQIRGRETTVTIDIDNHRVWVTKKKILTLPEDIGIRIKDPFEGEIDSGSYQVTFYPEGASSGAEIILTRKATSYSITVDPLTGSSTNKTYE